MLRPLFFLLQAPLQAIGKRYYGEILTPDKQCASAFAQQFVIVLNLPRQIAFMPNNHASLHCFLFAASQCTTFHF